MKVLALAILTAGAALALGKLPVAFEPNRGQAGPGVQYIAHGRGYSLTLRADGAGLQGRGGLITATLPGSRPGQGQPEAPLRGRVNFLVGDASQWRTDIPTYSRVRYAGVYPGIDLVYYGIEGQLEYDFVVGPGADPRKIRIQYDGGGQIRVDARGDLVIESPDGELRQARPTVYQEFGGERHPVAGGYVLRGRTVRFELGAYDRKRPLVIDPTLTWATYFGGSLTDQVFATATDAAGNVYATGGTLSSRGDQDAFITKFNPTGTTALLTTLIGGTLGDDVAYGIAVDSAGNVYLAGGTNSDDFPIVGVSSALSGAGYDGFIAKVEPTLKTYVYAGYLGATGDELIFGMAVDANSNLWVTGATTSTNFPISRTGAQKVNAGGIDGFISQFDPAGALLYSSYLGGSGDDYSSTMAMDASGNMYIGGSTTSKDFPGTSSGFQTANAGATDAWVAKASPAGAVMWTTYLGGTGDDEVTALAADASGVYLTGDTASSNFPTVKAVQGTFAGGPRDIMVAKLSADGSKLLYSTYLGGSGDEIGNAIAVDGSGAAYVGGSSASANFPSNSAFQASIGGGVDGTITAFAPGGDTLQFSSFIGGTLTDYVNAVSVSCTSGLIIGGLTVSTNFPVTGGVAQAKYGGGASDGFIAQLDAGKGTAATISAGGIVNAATSASAPVSPGSLVSLYGTNLANGVFSAASTPLPTVLGGTTVTVNGTAVPLVYVSAGQINFQLPYEVTAGTASATVTAGCGASAAAAFQVVRAAPYLLLGTENSAVVANQDGTINTADNAAPKGSIVTVYMIGIGPLDSSVATGAAAPSDSLVRATLPAKATIGGFDTSIKFLGLTPNYVGLAQANLEIPNLSPGKYPIVITIDGVDSNAAFMWVK